MNLNAISQTLDIKSVQNHFASPVFRKTFTAMENRSYADTAAIVGLNTMAHNKNGAIHTSLTALKSAEMRDITEQAKASKAVLNANEPLNTMLSYLGLLTEVVPQITFWNQAGDYDKVMSILPLKRNHRPGVETITLSSMNLNYDDSYDRSAYSFDADIKYQSNTAFLTQITGRRSGGIEAGKTSFFAEWQNGLLQSYTGYNELLDAKQRFTKTAVEHLRKLLFKNFLVGHSNLPDSAGLLNTNVDTSSINTALGWANFTSYAECVTLVNARINAFRSVTAGYGMPDELYISFEQNQKLMAPISAPLSGGGTVEVVRPKIDVLKEVFSNAIGKPFKIEVIQHFGKIYASKTLRLANADYSVLQMRDEYNTFDVPTDIMYTVLNGGAYDANGYATEMYWMQTGELLLGRPQLITTFRNANFT